MVDDYALEFPEPTYSGREYTADDVEALRVEHRAQHEAVLTRFRSLESEYSQAAGAVRQGIDADRWARQLEELSQGPTTMGRFRRALSRVGLAKRKPPLAQELEGQLETVQDRIHRVARLRESLDAHVEALEADIARLNRQVVEAAKDEERAAAHVLELSEALADREQKLLYWEPADRESAAYRAAAAEVDELKRRIRVHGAKARAYGHAENRLAGIVAMNRRFLEMLSHTAENMDQLATAASQVVDDIAGNVRALASLSLAGEVARDLMEATQRLKAGVNRVATAASNTSLELTRDISEFVADLSVYEQETVDLVDQNLTEERRIRQAEVEAAIARAYETTSA